MNKPNKHVCVIALLLLTCGCHAIYLNAELIDLQAGSFVTGNHNRGPLETVLLSASNELGDRRTVLMGDFHKTSLS